MGQRKSSLKRLSPTQRVGLRATRSGANGRRASRPAHKMLAHETDTCGKVWVALAAAGVVIDAAIPENCVARAEADKPFRTPGAVNREGRIAKRRQLDAARVNRLEPAQADGFRSAAGERNPHVAGGWGEDHSDRAQPHRPPGARLRGARNQRWPGPSQCPRECAFAIAAAMIFERPRSPDRRNQETRPFRGGARPGFDRPAIAPSIFGSQLHPGPVGSTGRGSSKSGAQDKDAE